MNHRNLLRSLFLILAASCLASCIFHRPPGFHHGPRFYAPVRHCR